MKKIFFIIFTVVWLPVFGQTDDFSGKIVYKYKFENPANGEDVTKQMTPYFGEEQHYYVNAQNYKSYDENGDLKQLYNSNTNTYYFKNPYTEELMEVDASNETSEILSVQHSDEIFKILGRTCKKIIIKTNTNETEYWYSSEIAVNPEKFKNHNFGGWARYMKESNGAIPLKIIVKAQNNIWTQTAIEIKGMKLGENDFKIETETIKN